MPAILGIAMIVNAVTVMAFGWDKLRAEHGRRRIREADLLALALVGGSPGAYAGRALFRHKTRKQPFSGRLHATAILQAIGVAGALGWWLGA